MNDYAEMTNAELRERIALLKQLKELEVSVSKPKASTDAPWYPETSRGEWVEYSPSNPVDRSRVIEVLHAYERKSRTFIPGPPGRRNLNCASSAWDGKFNWDSSNAADNVVAVILKN